VNVGKSKQKPVMIPADLHAALKELSNTRRMKLGGMVEVKLRELLEPQQLELVAEGAK